MVQQVLEKYKVCMVIFYLLMQECLFINLFVQVFLRCEWGCEDKKILLFQYFVKIIYFLSIVGMLVCYKFFDFFENLFIKLLFFFDVFICWNVV